VELERILEALCAKVPEAIGAVLCDFEGETVVTALGRAEPPVEAAARAAEHVPKNLALTMPVAQFLVRLAGAEPCAPLRLFSETCLRHRVGELGALEAQYATVELLVERLPEDFYVVVVLRRPALPGRARYHLRRAAVALAPHVC